MQTKLIPFWRWNLGVLLLICLFLNALAEDEGEDWRINGSSDQRAHRALQAGEVLPITEIIKIMEDRLEQEIIGIEFEFEHQRWVYEFTLLNNVGKISELYVDAANGQPLIGWTDESANIEDRSALQQDDGAPEISAQNEPKPWFFSIKQTVKRLFRSTNRHDNPSYKLDTEGGDSGEGGQTGDHSEDHEGDGEGNDDGDGDGDGDEDDS